MAATALSIYNKALQLLGERRLANIYEDREPRYVLDEIASMQAYGMCLEMAKPRFAVRTVPLANPITSYLHDLDQVYSFPADYLSLLEEPGVHGANASFFSDALLQQPVDRYLISGRTVATDIPTNLWMRYISISPDLSTWTPMFANFVATYIAREAASRINPSRIEYCEARFAEALGAVREMEGIKENPLLPRKQTFSLSTPQLAIYNQIAHALGQNEFRHIGDESQLRMAIDSQWFLARDFLYETIQPRFATQSITLTDAGDSANHAFDNVFDLPADFLTLVSVHSDENLDFPVDRYLHEDNQLFTEKFDPIYLRYIQDDVTETTWTASFQRALTSYIAMNLSPQYAPANEASLAEIFKANLLIAQDLDSVREPTSRAQKASGPLSTDQLGIYNQVAHHLGQSQLRHVNNESELRLAIDTQYGVSRDFLLETVTPRFATETATLADAGDSTVHAFDNVFTLPSDMVTLLDVWSDANLDFPVLRYLHEDTQLYVDAFDPIYIRFIQDDVAESSWTATFKEALSAYLATKLSSQFAPDKVEYLSGMMGQTLANAIAADSTREADPRPQKASGPLSADELAIYNQVVQQLGMPELRHVNDESEIRLAIDSHYGIVRDQLLELIKPRFATTFATLADGADSAVHAFDNVFTLPNNLVTLIGIFSDTELDQPVTRYLHEDTELYVSNYDTIYLRYVQNDVAESAWTATFKQAVAAKIAARLAGRFALKDQDQSSPTYASAVKYMTATFENEVTRSMQEAMMAESLIEPAVRPVKATRTLDDTYRDLYNKALQVLRLPQLTSNTDESQRKVALDYAMDNKAVETVFELISWGFLYKRVKLAASVTEIPTFGFQFAFDVPADFIRIDNISANEYFRDPLPYTREGDFFYADVDELYLRYLSDDQVTTPATWPVYVHNLVAAELARNCAGLPDADRDNADRIYEEYKNEAYSTDAQRNPPQVIGSGSWTRARGSYGRSRYRRP